MTTTNAAKDFSKAVRAALKTQGIAIYSSTWLPGVDGSYANGERGYFVNDNGTSRILTYVGVIAQAGAK